MPKNAAHTEKLLMRIRSVKWHAATTASSSHHAAARAGAAAIVADLEAMEVAARAPGTEADSTAGELQVDSLSARLTRLGPQWPMDSSGVPVPFTARRGATPPALLLGSGGSVSDPRQRADDAQLVDPAAEPGKPV